MKYFLLFLLPLTLFSSKVEYERWPKGETFLTFLEHQSLPQSTYYDLDGEDQKLTEEIRAGFNYQILRDSNGTLEQALIPVNDELQLHLTCAVGNQEGKGLACDVTPTPIMSISKREAFMLEIENSPYYDIQKATGSKALAQIFVNGFKNSLNFRRDLRKGDKLVMVYDQKYRFGQPFSMPVLQVAMIEMRGKKHSIYLNSDERYYDEKGAQVEGFLLSRPVKNARISSKFTKRRFHPILKRYRAHLGIDYAARRGTPIMAAGSGKVISAGYSRGYGNVTKIRHSDGYMTLYAHQKSFKRGIKRGKYVKQGQVIGYVGSTGMSTGPHLHFGLYKNGRAINPARVVRVTTKKLGGKARKSFLQVKKSLDEMVAHHLEAGTRAQRLDDYQYVYYLERNERDDEEFLQ
ncbi:MAG: peptidoglycan DD-metalloendopeptidase family protein [Campylobacterota bacterium]|nr:peptidoglycan DD-metalloendopeptidase family protein [Campylobacterota bacterium]